MGKFISFVRALQHGSVLADPANWKRRQVLLEALSGLILAVAIFLPDIYRDQIDPALAQSVAAGIAAVVQLFVSPSLTVATTDKLGLPLIGRADSGPRGDHRDHEPRASDSEHDGRFYGP